MNNSGVTWISQISAVLSAAILVGTAAPVMCCSLQATTTAPANIRNSAPTTGPMPQLSAQKSELRAEPRSGDDLKIGGLRITVWRPTSAGTHPMVVFSHGLHGSSRQSTFLMKALADHGYLVIAPNHKDALSFGTPNAGLTPPTQSFANAYRWSDATYRDRAEDIRGLIKALKSDPTWNQQIDWTKVALAGHSLGGYTVLGLAGGWKSWTMPEVKAVIALSPFCTPYTAGRLLTALAVPVMYQGGTLDFGITPSVRIKGGAYDQTPSPTVFIEFLRAGHFAWTDLNPEFQPEISSYCVAFLDRYLKGDQKADITNKLPHVAELRSK